MSTVIYFIFILVLAAACFGSWKGALWWDRRTREARDVDPLEQEVRELNAALSIARKDVVRLTSGLTESKTTVAALEQKLNEAELSLTDIQNKYATTKESNLRAIEKSEEFDQEIMAVRRELEVSNRNAEELNVQLKAAVSGSGLVAGMDDIVSKDGDNDLYEARSRIDALKTEIEDWRKRYDSLYREHSDLKRQHEELPDIGQAEQQRQ